MELKSKGLETLKEVYERAKGFTENIMHKHKNKTILIVSHGLFNKALICAITRKPARHIYEIETPKNTSVCVFEITEDKKHKSHLMNCIKHLE